VNKTNQFSNGQIFCLNFDLLKSSYYDYFIKSKGKQINTSFSDLIFFKKTNSIKKKRKNFFFPEKFLKIFQKNGLQLKYLVFLNKSISFLMYNFYFFKESKNTKNLVFKDYILIRDYMYIFYNFNNLLKIYFDLLEQLFIFKITKLEKKYKKKSKKKFTGRYCYLQPSKRAGYVFRNIINYSTLFSEYQLTIRLGNSFIRTLTDYKESYLYKRKIDTYNNLLNESKYGSQL